jgi:hypothetical protein
MLAWRRLSPPSPWLSPQTPSLRSKYLQGSDPPRPYGLFVPPGRSAKAVSLGCMCLAGKRRGIGPALLAYYLAETLVLLAIEAD